MCKTYCCFGPEPDEFMISTMKSSRVLALSPHTPLPQRCCVIAVSCVIKAAVRAVTQHRTTTDQRQRAKQRRRSLSEGFLVFEEEHVSNGRLLYHPCVSYILPAECPALQSFIDIQLTFISDRRL